MTIEIFRKEFTGFSDYLVIECLLPTIFIGKVTYSSYPKWGLYIKFANNLKIEKDTISYHFRFRIFGFGLAVYRQWSY